MTHYRAAGPNPVLYLSRKVRDEQAERIKTAEDLTEEDRAMPLAHVARTPYLQVTSGARNRLKNRRSDPLATLGSIRSLEQSP